MAGVYQVDYLTSADQVIPDWLVTLLGEAETATRLGIASLFGDEGLAQMNSFGPVVF